MEVTQKEYDYDEVIKFTGSGGELDQALSTLQGHLVDLYNKIKECEPLFHGKGTTSSIYIRYKNLYNMLGTESTSESMWFNTKVSCQLVDTMYTNALNQKKKDS